MKDDQKTKKRGRRAASEAKPRAASARAKPKTIAAGRDKVAEKAAAGERTPRARAKTAATGRGRRGAKQQPEAFEVAAAATVSGMTPIEPPKSRGPRVPAPALRGSAPVEFAKEDAAPSAKFTTLRDGETTPATALAVFGVGADQARQVYAQAQATGETLRQAVTESAAATTRGAIEINTKVLDLVRAQSEATLSLWRSALTAGSLSEAIQQQSSAARQAYETAAVHWKDLADATGRWLSDVSKPLRAAWTNEAR